MLHVLTRFSNGAKKKCNRILARARRLLWDMPLLSTYNNRGTNTMALHTFPLNFFTNEPTQTHTSAPLPEVVVSVCSFDLFLAWARGKIRNICYQSSSRKWGKYFIACFSQKKVGRWRRTTAVVRVKSPKLWTGEKFDSHSGRPDLSHLSCW